MSVYRCVKSLVCLIRRVKMHKYQVWIPVWEQYVVDADSEKQAIDIVEKSALKPWNVCPFDGREIVRAYAEEAMQ